MEKVDAESRECAYANGRSGSYMYKPDLRNTCCRLYPVWRLGTFFVTVDSNGSDEVQVKKRTSEGY